jgi:hypothetical protein
VMQNFQKRFRGCIDNNGRHLTETIFRKWILQLRCFEIKLTLAINLLKQIVHFSFYFNLKIVRYFCRILYIWHINHIKTLAALGHLRNSCYYSTTTVCSLVVMYMYRCSITVCSTVWKNKVKDIAYCLYT